jgi:hypothetical protein
MEQIEVKVRALVENFKLKTLDDTPNDNMCFTVCYTLSEHLKNHKVEHSLVKGFVNEIHHHYWIGFNNLIIDLTPNQTQFKHTNTIASPYIDQLPSTYKAVQIVRINNEVELSDLINSWSEPLLNYIFGKENTDPTNIVSTQFLMMMTPVYLMFLVKAAIVLLNDSNPQESNTEFLDILNTACYGYSLENVKLLFDKPPDGWGGFENQFINWITKNL